ncbi:unnamed protein product [Didymodactylos carnosus]|uniref:Uncharacterized protein n=1 Tax=Didymodactylos carnosus TaxID=1234261 RepID=A0A8S2DPR1_9BILA|nr:unnamed protein product [Didymodactylos carnosus]CAF3738533.1 unnamed protein product [Didymodactylos carnosus]
MRREQEHRCLRCFPAHFMSLLQQAPSKDMTIGYYIDYEQKLVEERHKEAELDDDINKQVELDNCDLLATTSALRLPLNDQQVLLSNTEMQESTNNQQQVPSNDITVVEQNLIDEQDRRLQLENDELMAGSSFTVILG